jgi:2,5-diketo-D-gluconate reductase B
MIMESIKLQSGYEMPVVGLGTWELTGKLCIQAVREALELGYRHIDTAYIYGNQREIAEAIQGSPVERSEIFITSKVWKDSLSHDKVMKQADKILDQLGTEYVDLLLVHWPSEEGVPLEETLSAFEKLADGGKTRSIGVSNFMVHHLEEALDVAKLPISNNQIKFNPGQRQEDVLEFCTEHDISVTAYSPLERGGVSGRRGPIGEIASSRGKSPAQIALRWLLQKGMVVIPKASSRSHLQENMEILDWELSREELGAIDKAR